MSSESSPVANWRIEKWFPQLSRETIDQLFSFYQELVKHNGTLHLVSTKSLPHADLVHFSDALLAFGPVYSKLNKNAPLYDIGGGNGFPGLVIAIVYPDVRVHIVEGEQKHAEFLKAVVKKLLLSNVAVIATQVEHLEEESIEQGICRGFATLAKAFLSLRKPFRVGGSMYFMKPSDWAQEISQVPTQLCSIWAPKLVHEYNLPETSSTFYVVVANKIS